ncbi:MAG: MGMT family protein, partial [Candidatus Coproplasma sp.]
ALMEQNFFTAVYQAVRQIPLGKVATYGDIAKQIGAPRCARQVGWALHNNPRPIEIPCHRVVFADGSLSAGFAFGGAQAQRELLESEGVAVSPDNKVDLNEYRC